MSRLAPLRVVHVQLERPLPCLTTDGRGVYAVFWLGDVPLGDCALAAEQLPAGPEEVARLAADAVVRAAGDQLFDSGFEADLPVRGPKVRSPSPDLRALVEERRPLQRLAAQAPGPAPDQCPMVSVVVCTRDRPRHLERCLTSLETSASAPKEVVVVDNAPTTEETRAVVQAFPAVTYVREPRPGLSAARNAALAVATGEFIAFTDDDVTVHPMWSARIASTFERHDVDAVTGLVLPAALDTPAQVAFERVLGSFNGGYRSFTFGPQYFARMRPYGVPVWRMGAGANMAIRRDALIEAGGFDERLGAGAAGCSEDSELWYRLLARGGRCRYEPTAVVFHHHRPDTAALEAQAYDYMRGHVAALWVQFGRHRDWGNVRRALGELPAWFLKRALTELPVSGPVKRRALMASFAGYFRGVAMARLALTTRRA